jgi:hypothetical protein
MKQTKFSNIRVIHVALVLFTMVLFGSCLKDKGPGTENYGNSPALISFQYAGFSVIPFITPVYGIPTDSVSLEVTLSVSSLTLSTPVTGTITADPASLDAYNADTTSATYPTVFTQIPALDYTLSNGGVVTINPGQQKVQFVVHIKGDLLDFTQNNALALKITSSTGAVIATNLNTAIILLKLKSLYAGNYTASGARIRFFGGNEASGIRDSFNVTGTIPLNTISPNEVDGQVADAGSGYTMALLVHSGGATPYPVDVIPDPLGTSPAAFIPGTSRGNSTYDPATKTFDLHFGYLNAAGALREVNEKLVAQ